MISVLICDDSALMRRSLKGIIEAQPDMRVVGAARDGEDAVAKARELSPDVITMDINMPVIDGITALQIISGEKIAPVIVVSSLTQEGAEITFQALALGAFDYVAKPGGTVSVNMAVVAEELAGKIRAAARPGTLKRLSRARERLSAPLRRKKTGPVSSRRPAAPALSNRLGFQAVALGISTGGPKVLFDVLPLLPENLNAAVFVVQHMPAQFIPSFVKRLDASCALPCVEAEAGMVVEPRRIYMGRGGFHIVPHLRVGSRLVIRTPREPHHAFIPSVDVMMAGVLSVFGNQTVGVLMTGMGDDGADGMVAIRQAGGITIAESEESAVVFGMPQEAIRRGGAEIVRPNWEIADAIIRAV